MSVNYIRILHTDLSLCNYIRILHTDLSVCNYIRIQNPYVKITYDSFTYRFLSVCNQYVTMFYIRILCIIYGFWLYVISVFLVVFEQKDDLELEIFVFNLSVAVRVIFKLDFIDFFICLWCLLIIFYLSLSSQIYITLFNINSNCITLLVSYITSRTVNLMDLLIIG